MSCPNCGSKKSLVIDTRPRVGYQWRRRECESCHRRFTTSEINRDLKMDAQELDDLRLRLRNIVRIAHGNFYQQYAVPGTPEDELVIPDGESERP